MTGGSTRAAVFGISDGLVSNVSLILGFAGGGVDASIVRLAGLAGAIAGGISMAAGEWISVSAQNELIERELEIERREIAHNAPAETAELAEMYRADGMSPDDATRAAARRDASPRRRPRPCTPAPSSASTPTGWRRRGGPPPSRSSPSSSAPCCP